MKADGNRIGQVIAAHVERAVRAGAHESAKENRYHNEKSREAFLEEIEDVFAPHMRAMFETVVNDPNVPDTIKDLLGHATEPTHQVEALVAIIVLPFILGPLAHAVADPFLLQLQQTMFAAHPERAIDPATAAVMVVKGARDYADALKDAEGAGINGNRFADMVKATGDPPAIQELLLAYRLGYIDKARLEHGIRQSRVKDEWVDVLERLRYVPPGAGAAVEFVLKGHMSEADGQRLYADNGLDPKYFATHVASTGRPPGPEQLLELLNRGEVSEAHVRQAIKQSDVNNAYIDDVLKLRRYYPPPRTIPTLLRSGAINDSQALHYLKSAGMTDELAAAYVKTAKKEKTTKAHTATESQVLHMYATRYITHAVATQRLEKLGYTADESRFVLAAADAEEHYRLQQQAVSIIRARYVAHRLDRSTVSRDMDTLGVPHEARDQLIRVWDLERQASAKAITPAEALAMFERNLPGWDEAHTLAWLEADGYSSADAHSLIQLAAAGSARTPQRAKTLTQAQVLKAYGSGRMSEAETLDRLRNEGLSETDARLLMTQHAPPAAPAT